MSEKITPKSQESLKPIESAERMQELAERFDEALEQSGEEASKSTEKARSAVERHAISQEKAATQSETDSAPAKRILSKQDRDESFNSTMSTIRQRLKPSEKRFSTVIHNEAVEKTSEIMQTSIGRSSILIGGFATTFIGSLLLYFVARRNGYTLENNYTFIFVLFVIGAISGLAIELLFRKYRSKQNR